MLDRANSTLKLKINSKLKQYYLFFHLFTFYPRIPFPSPNSPMNEDSHSLNSPVK